MNRHPSRSLRAIFALSAVSLALMLCAAPAEACSLCAMAMADLVLPPFGLWCLIATLWYGGTVLIAHIHRTRLPGVPGPAPGACGILACLLVCAGVTGPIVFLPLFLVAASGFARSIAGLRQEERKPLRRGLNRLGYAASAVVLAASCGSLYLRQQRTTADFIVRWPGTGPAYAALETLAKNNSPADREQIRFVAEHATGEIAAKAEEALARP